MPFRCTQLHAVAQVRSKAVGHQHNQPHLSRGLTTNMSSAFGPCFSTTYNPIAYPPTGPCSLHPPPHSCQDRLQSSTSPTWPATPH